MLWIALQPGLEGAAEKIHAGHAADPVASAEQDADLQALAWQALAYTPRVTRLEEAVLMEVSASVRLFGGLQALLQRLVREHAQARAASLASLGSWPESAQPRGVAAGKTSSSTSPGPLASAGADRRAVKYAKGADNADDANDVTHATAQPSLGSFAVPALRGAPGHTALAALARLRTGLPWRQSSRLALGDLPLFTLSAALPHAAVLERLGCRDWNDLRQLPRDGVARRFGQPLLIALDQAFGEQPESHDWLTLPEVFDEALELPALVEHASALMFGVNRLLAHLRLWLLARGLGLLGLQVRWLLDPRRDVARAGEFTLRLSEASQDMTHVARLLAEHLAQQQLPAPAHTLRLRSLDTAPLTGRSHSLLMEDRQKGDSLAQLVERLSARLGPERVLRWQAQARHVPERMQRWVPAQVNAWAALRGGNASASRKTKASPPAATLTQVGAAPGQPPALLPSWLLDEPLPLMLQDERPCYEGPLTLLVGPQRLETTGWAPLPGSAGPGAEAPVMRDYFMARSEQAGLLWIFRERPSHTDDGPAGWFLQGIFA